MSDVGELTAVQAAEAIAAGDLDPAELASHYHRVATGDDLNAFTWTPEEPPAPAEGPLGGLEDALAGVFGSLLGHTDV